MIADIEAVRRELTADHCSWCGTEDDVETEGHRFALLPKEGD